jgi:hypothetical protein
MNPADGKEEQVAFFPGGIMGNLYVSKPKLRGMTV